MRTIVPFYIQIFIFCIVFLILSVFSICNIDMDIDKEWSLQNETRNSSVFP
jgi:hypothetical protein